MHPPTAPRRLADDQGMTLAEVLVALAILAIVMPALAAVTFSTLRATQANDQRTVATNLAQSELEQVRSVSFPELVANMGRITRTVASAGTTYQVARDTSWTALESASDPCTATGLAGNELLRIDVEVSPVGQPDRIARSSTTLARPSGDADDPTRGALGVQVTDHRDPPQGVPGAVVTITRTGSPTVTRNQSTPASGCVVFTDLLAGNYTISVHKPGYVGRTYGESTTLTRTATVVAGELQVPPAIRYAARADVGFVAVPRWGEGVAQPATLPTTMSGDFGHVPGVRGTTLTGLWPGQWDAWAGDCPTADPLTWSGGGRQPPVRLVPGANTVTVELAVTRLTVPASPTAPVTWPVSVTAVAADCLEATATLTFPALGPVGSTEVPGALDLGLPYGTWTLTAQDATGRTVAVATAVLAPTATGIVAAVVGP